MPLDPLPLWTSDPQGPTLTVYPTTADEPRGSVLVLPGGGYQTLAEHEGPGYAEALNRAGFHAAVLRYRLAPGHRHPDMIHDAQRGMRLFKTHDAVQDTLRGGFRGRGFAVMGSSAGGHLGASLLVHHSRFVCDDDDLAGRVSARPDAGVLCYPVTDLMLKFSHVGSRTNLLGDPPDPALAQLMSPSEHVTADTPPTFLWHTYEDAAVPADNSFAFAAACRAKGVPVELLCFETGRHGLGLALDVPGVRVWFEAACRFLDRHLAVGTSSPQPMTVAGDA